MKAEGLVKQEHIVEAAIRRFSHFGISKTTLSEIAEDLAISKPSVFYYFADKNGLISAVVRKIINEFFDGLENRLQNAATTEEAIHELIEAKRAHFKKYILLAIQGTGTDLAKIPAELNELYVEARKKSIDLISSFFSKAIDKGQINPVDTSRTAELILDTLSALEHFLKVKHWRPEEKEFDELFDRQKELVSLFFNGLKADKWKN